RAETPWPPVVRARVIERVDDHVARVRELAPAALMGVAFVARGSSDHAAVYGRYLAEMASHPPASLAAPSLHTLYRADVDYRGWLVVALSQSGATPEIETVLARLRAAGARTIAIVNEPDSAVARAADLVMVLEAGSGLAVPATKT